MVEENIGEVDMQMSKCRGEDSDKSYPSVNLPKGTPAGRYERSPAATRVHDRAAEVDRHGQAVGALPGGRPPVDDTCTPGRVVTGLSLGGTRARVAQLVAKGTHG